MAAKGTIRTGETFCLSCNEPVDRSASKCPSCNSDLDSEVKAFRCPKCQRAIALGEPLCPGCGLKFKVKTLKTKESPGDDQFLARLIEWGKVPKESPEGPDLPATEAERPPAAKGKADLEQLRRTIGDLMANRSEMLERMQRRIEDEKQRLARISKMEGDPGSAGQVEAEIMSLADEMADITMLQAHMESLSDEISSLLNSVEVSGPVKERGLAAKALRLKLNEKEKELEELRSREDELKKREEMVDRKIQSYAQKKKQLDQDEQGLKEQLLKLDEERQSLERIKAAALSAKTDGAKDVAREEWLAEQARLAKRISGLQSSVVKHRTGAEPTVDEIEQAEKSIDASISNLESEISFLIGEKADLQKKISEASIIDEDMRALLKVLDQLLGQLPEEVVDKFAKSDEFAIYERVLDRFKV